VTQAVIYPAHQRTLGTSSATRRSGSSLPASLPGRTARRVRRCRWCRRGNWCDGRAAVLPAWLGRACAGEGVGVAAPAVHGVEVPGCCAPCCGSSPKSAARPRWTLSRAPVSPLTLEGPGLPGNGEWLPGVPGRDHQGHGWSTRRPRWPPTTSRRSAGLLLTIATSSGPCSPGVLHPGGPAFPGLSRSSLTRGSERMRTGWSWPCGVGQAAQLAVLPAERFGW